MTNNTISIEPLLKRIEAYAATTLQLYKLYLVDFIANIFAEIYAKLIVMVLFSSCILFLSIGIALWLGEFLGKSYYGFLFVSGIYLITTLIFLRFKQRLINEPTYNRTAKKIK